MTISAVSSMESSLANMSTGKVDGAIQQKIAVLVLKQILNTQEAQAKAILAMIAPTPTIDGSGKIVNIGA